jgi:hypothetical protein
MDLLGNPKDGLDHLASFRQLVGVSDQALTMPFGSRSCVADLHPTSARIATAELSYRTLSEDAAPVLAHHHLTTLARAYKHQLLLSGTTTDVVLGVVAEATRRIGLACPSLVRRLPHQHAVAPNFGLLQRLGRVVAAIGDRLLSRPPQCPLHLIEHRHELSIVRPRGAHLGADHQPALRHHRLSVVTQYIAPITAHHLRLGLGLVTVVAMLLLERRQGLLDLRLQRPTILQVFGQLGGTLFASRLLDRLLQLRDLAHHLGQSTLQTVAMIGRAHRARRLQLGAIGGMQHRIDETRSIGDPHHLREHPTQRLLMALPESPQGVVVRRPIARQPDQGHPFAARLLQRPHATHPPHVAVQPNPQQYRPRVLRPALDTRRRRKPHALEVQRPHELAHESHRIIRRHPLLLTTAATTAAGRTPAPARDPSLLLRKPRFDPQTTATPALFLPNPL